MDKTRSQGGGVSAGVTALEADDRRPSTPSAGASDNAQDCGGGWALPARGACADRGLPSAGAIGASQRAWRGRPGNAGCRSRGKERGHGACSPGHDSEGKGSGGACLRAASDRESAAGAEGQCPVACVALPAHMPGNNHRQRSKRQEIQDGTPPRRLGSPRIPAWGARGVLPYP